MTVRTHDKPWLLLGLLAIAALGLALGAPVLGQEDQAEAPPPPPKDNEAVEGDWPPANDAKAEAPWRGRRATRTGRGRAQPRNWSGRSGPAGDRPGFRGQRPGGPGMGGRFGPGMQGTQRARLSDEDRKLAMEVLEDINPKLAERLKDTKDNPERAQAMLRHLWPRIHKLMETKKSDPELYEWRVKDMKIGLECQKLQRQFQEASKGGDRDRVKEIRSQIAEKVEEHFDVRQKMRELELERLERRLAEARKQLEKRAANRKELVEKRVGDLTNEQHEPMW